MKSTLKTTLFGLSLLGLILFAWAVNPAPRTNTALLFVSGFLLASALGYWIGPRLLRTSSRFSIGICVALVYIAGMTGLIGLAQMVVLSIAKAVFSVGSAQVASWLWLIGLIVPILLIITSTHSRIIHHFIQQMRSK